jgi:hypothetical protein
MAGYKKNRYRKTLTEDSHAWQVIDKDIERLQPKTLTDGRLLKKKKISKVSNRRLSRMAGY